MMMKQLYMIPEIEVLRLACEDIMTASTPPAYEEDNDFSYMFNDLWA